MIEDLTWVQHMHTVFYGWLPGGVIMPFIGAVAGFVYGLYRYVRSFKYLYYYYIEHGAVIWWTDNYTTELRKVSKKHDLCEHYTVFGYVGGLLGCALFPVAGIIIGSLWPIAVLIGILTIPNLALRHIAKEKRTKALFEQALKGEKE